MADLCSKANGARQIVYRFSLLFGMAAGSIQAADPCEWSTDTINDAIYNAEKLFHEDCRTGGRVALTEVGAQPPSPD